MLLLVTIAAAAPAARLSEDGRALILQDEAGAQYGVAATRDPSTAAREIRLTGKPVLPTLVLRCGTTERVIPLTATEATAAGPVACYRVPEELAQLALRADCRLVLVGTFVLARLHRYGLLTKEFVRATASVEGINVLYDVAEPLEQEFNPYYEKEDYEILRSLIGRVRSGRVDFRA